MQNNLLDLLAKDISDIFKIFNNVIVRMIKDRSIPYIIIVLDKEKIALKYNIDSEVIENITFDFPQKEGLLKCLNAKKIELKTLWVGLGDNENINGLYSVQDDVR